MYHSATETEIREWLPQIFSAFKQIMRLDYDDFYPSVIEAINLIF